MSERVISDVRSTAATGRLAGRTAIVTGGAGGIGAATAGRFVAEGAQVVIVDLLAEEGTALATKLGANARFRRADVTSEDDIAAAVAAVVEEFGRLDVMFNNAGIMGATGSIARLDLDDVSRTIAVVLGGTIVGMKCAAGAMIAQGSGVILSTSSPAGLIGGVGPHAYSAAKAAIIGLTRSVAAELRPHGIRVNAIVPGATVTAMTAEVLADGPGDLDGAQRVMAERALLNRAIQPEDIAEGALYLASDAGAFVTGQTLVIDAGLTTVGGTSPFATGVYAAPGTLAGPTGKLAEERSG